MTQLATFGGGCFWCTEAVFEQVRGVSSVVSGYAGGHVPNPTYEAVCGKKTGHAEVVQITFDPSVISYHDLLTIFFGTHDPTTPNRQGADVGPQYRSAIFFHDAEQEKVAKELIAELNAEGIFGAPIVTEVVPLSNYYPAEDYHQGYYRANPMQGYCQAVVGPKAAKFRKLFAKWQK
jgi:peptide-methionine (S)-S-oxide reductase